MPGVPHHQHVEVVRLGDVSNNIPGCPVFVDSPLCVPEDYNFIGEVKPEPKEDSSYVE